MGFKKRAVSKEKKYEEALRIFRTALEQYADDEKWFEEDHTHCYDCHCIKFRTSFLANKYEDGWDAAVRALREVDELFGE